MFLLIVVMLTGALDNDPDFKKGQDQLETFDYEKATKTFDKLANRPGLAPGDKAVALVWLGLSYAELRDQAHASLAFEDAVTADPLIVLPRDASPKIKALLEDARARVRARPHPTEAGTATPPDGSTDSATTTGPNVTAPTPSNGTPVTPEPAASALVPVAIGTAVVGGVVALGGGGVWAFGLALRQQAIDAKFQSDAANLRDQSIATQIGGQVAAGIGVAALVAGGAMFAVSTME